MHYMICSGPPSVSFRENNTAGAVVANFTLEEGVELAFRFPFDHPFGIRGNEVFAKEPLDYETETTYVVNLLCMSLSSGPELNLVLVVTVENINDNPPVFPQSQVPLRIDELLPVGTSVGSFPATDKDPDTELLYRLTSDQDYFELQPPSSPNLVVRKLLDFDRVKQVTLTLFVQDTPSPPPDGEPSFTASTTILVSVLDVDNRPPWFLPCKEDVVGGAMICQGAGYSGSVVLTEQEVGVLPLTPGPLYAIDGDFGINEEITYRFLSGNDAGLFQIGAESGNITMVRAADVPGPINLTVLAAQKLNSFQYATTKVTIRVLLRSRNPPRFERTSYGAVVTGVGTMALDSDNTTQPLRIQATDADFAGGVNPDVTYNIKGSSGFSLIGGYLFMTEDRPLGSVTFQVAAVDTASGETATAELSVEVTSGLATTQATPTTQTTPTEETTGVPTSNSSMTTEDSHSTASTAPPPTGGVPGVTGGYGLEAMAALGASLAVLLAVCLLVIGLLLCRMKKSKADWRKMTEANVFRSSLAQGPGGQFTNEAFQSDEDAVSSHSAASQEVDLKPGGGQQGIEAVSVLGKEAGIKSTAAPYIVPHAVLPGDSSSRGSNNDEDEVEVKPILTKERRAEDGYKSVWFKEDIDPNAKQEVVIIPDNREGEGDGEEGSSDEEDGPPASQLVFDADMDSGLGVKMEDPESDDDDRMLTSDL